MNSNANFFSKAANERGVILVVDDEKEICMMLRRHFTFLNYEVDIAEDGAAALAIMENKRYDVVISDIKMPQMDGVSLLRQIRTNYPMTRCIMITGYVTMDNVLACMRLGADTCIFKPFTDLSELENAVKIAIEDLTRWRNKLLQLIKMKP